MNWRFYRSDRAWVHDRTGILEPMHFPRASDADRVCDALNYFWEHEQHFKREQQEKAIERTSNVA